MRPVETYLLNRDNSRSVWVERNMEDQPTHCHPGAKYTGGIQEDEWNVYCHGRACSAQSSPHLGTSTALSTCTQYALKHCPLTPTTKLGWTKQAQERSETQTHTNTPMLCKDPSPTYISVTSKCNLQRSTQWPACNTATKEHLPSSFIRVPNNHIHHKQNDLDHNSIIDGLEVGISAHKLTGEDPEGAGAHDMVYMAGDMSVATHSVRESCTLKTRTGLIVHTQSQ